MGICAAKDDEDYTTEYDYDEEKEKQDAAELEAIAKQNNVVLKRELRLKKRVAIRDSANELTFTIVRADNGTSFKATAFGYETIAAFKNKLVAMMKDTPLLWEPLLKFEGKELHDGSTFKELQMRNDSKMKVEICAIGPRKKGQKGQARRH